MVTGYDTTGFSVLYAISIIRSGPRRLRSTDSSCVCGPIEIQKLRLGHYLFLKLPMGLVRGVLENDHAKTGVFGEDWEVNQQRFGSAVLITAFHRMRYQALALGPSPYHIDILRTAGSRHPFTTSMGDNRPGNKSTISQLLHSLREQITSIVFVDP